MSLIERGLNLGKAVVTSLATIQIEKDYDEEVANIPTGLKEAIAYHEQEVRYYRAARMRDIRHCIPSDVRHEMIRNDIRAGALHAYWADELRGYLGLPAKYDRERIKYLLFNRRPL